MSRNANCLCNNKTNQVRIQNGVAKKMVVGCPKNRGRRRKELGVVVDGGDWCCFRVARKMIFVEKSWGRGERKRGEEDKGGVVVVGGGCGG